MTVFNILLGLPLEALSFSNMSVPGAVAHNKTVVFGVYRLLLRQIGKTFRGRNAISPSTSSSTLLTTAEDESTKVQAKKYAREGFNTYRHERFAGTTEAEEGIKHAKGVAQILEQNVVQGVKSKKDKNAPYSKVTACDFRPASS